MFFSQKLSQNCRIAGKSYFLIYYLSAKLGKIRPIGEEMLSLEKNDMKLQRENIAFHFSGLGV